MEIGNLSHACDYDFLGMGASTAAGIRANVAIRDERPMAGSRRHYSLVDGGKWQEEEMPKQKVTFADLQEEVLP